MAEEMGEVKCCGNCEYYRAQTSVGEVIVCDNPGHCFATPENKPTFRNSQCGSWSYDGALPSTPLAG